MGLFFFLWLEQRNALQPFGHQADITSQGKARVPVCAYVIIIIEEIKHSPYADADDGNGYWGILFYLGRLWRQTRWGTYSSPGFSTFIKLVFLPSSWPRNIYSRLNGPYAFPSLTRLNQQKHKGRQHCATWPSFAHLAAAPPLRCGEAELPSFQLVARMECHPGRVEAYVDADDMGCSVKYKYSVSQDLPSLKSRIPSAQGNALLSSLIHSPGISKAK